ncbi:hypothetical protein KEJ51_07670 [Candidatus Bathyarchaeota archaeon]|nr:hypothetical protein [Candidatus Bathyarchaeota archaeon]
MSEPAFKNSRKSCIRTGNPVREIVVTEKLKGIKRSRVEVVFFRAGP